MVVTEDGVVDYIVCPMRYAFLWHYNVSATEPRSLYRQCVRSGLSGLFRLLYEGHLDLPSMREALKPEMDSLPKTLRPFIDNLMVKYAAAMHGRSVLAYDLPVVVDVGDITFAGVLDVLFTEDDVVTGAHVDDLPSSLEPAARRALMGLVQAGFQDSIRDEIAARGQTLAWKSLFLRGSGIREEFVQDTEFDAAFFESIGQCITNRAFHPRWHRASCRSCGFRPACRAEWATAHRLDKPKATSEMIKLEIQNASLPS